MKVDLLEYPGDQDWMEVKRRALVTSGLRPVNPPDMAWKRKILQARHSPIRYLRFSFWLEVPSYVSVHLCRHVHAQPYVRSQRNDRQSEYDRDAARQDTPVQMIWDLNAEELLTVASKRLCSKADPRTRECVGMMCFLVEQYCPEFTDMLVPACQWMGGVCREMYPCGKYPYKDISCDRQRDSESELRGTEETKQ